MEPFEIMVSESQERMLAVVEPAEVDEVLALCEKWQTGAAAIGEVTGSGPVRVLRRRRGGRRRPGRGPGRRAARSTTSSPAEPEGWIYGNATRRAVRSPDARGPGTATIAAGAARLAQHRLQALGLRAVRLDRRLAHRAPAREPPTPPCCTVPESGTRDRGLDRRQRPAGRLRPLRRRGRGGARVRPEPGLRRRRAARPDQLPQLRQPREAGTSPGSSTARSAASPTPAPRSASRSSAATSRSTTRPATARSTRRPVVGMVGELPDPARRSPAARFAARATRSSWSARSRPRWPARSWRSCAASWRRGCPRPTIERRRGGARRLVRERGPRRTGSPRPTTSATAASPARSPRWRSPAASAAASTWTRWSSCAAAPARRALFGEGPGGFVVSASGEAIASLRAAGAEVLELGETGGDEILIEAAEQIVAVPLAEAEAAWRSLGERAESGDV